MRIEARSPSAEMVHFSTRQEFSTLTLCEPSQIGMTVFKLWCRLYASQITPKLNSMNLSDVLRRPFRELSVASELL